MKRKVYIETTIPSYLTAWPSRDLVRAGQQQLTREWWEVRDRYELVVSQLVLQEAGGGDPDAARERLKALEGLPVLVISETATQLAHRLLEAGSLHQSLRRMRSISPFQLWEASTI